MNPFSPFDGGRDGEAGSWWNPASPDEVREEQARVAAARSAIAVGLQAKPPADSLEARSALASWRTLDAQIATYTGEQPSALWWTRDDQFLRGQSLESQIEAWRAKFSSLGAGVPSAPVVPVKADPSAMLTKVTVIVAILAGVYVISKTGLPEIFPRKKR